MIEFAVQIEGEEKGRWVLAVDPIGERLLTTNEDQTLRWVDMSTCRVIKAANPEIARPVVVMQPPPQQQKIGDRLTLPRVEINGRPAR